MKVRIETKYKTCYDFKEWIEEYSVYRKRYKWLTIEYINFKMRQAKKEKDYDLLVSIDHNRHLLYDIILDLIHKKERGGDT